MDICKIIAEYVSTSYSEWISGKKKDALARQDVSLRKFKDLDNQYLEAWHLINTLCKINCVIDH